MADKWIKKRHRVLKLIFVYLIGTVEKIKYGIKIDRFPDKDGQYVVVMNHQTAGDQFFVSMAMNQTLYFLATEDIMSNGLISRLLEFAVRPIPIKKQTTDVKAVKTALRVAREGGTLALAPEGNRTYSGRTVHINPAIATFIMKMKLPVAVFKIEGGYGALPRWADHVRKGPIHAGVTRVIPVEEYKDMTKEEFADLIRQELYVDEAVSDAEYKYLKQAEFLERAVYVCPDCGFSGFHSHGDIIECDTCHRRIRHNPDKSLVGVDKEFPFKYVADWYEYQTALVNRTDVTKLTDKPVFTDVANLFGVKLYKNKYLIKKAVKLQLYGDRIEMDSGSSDEKVFKFAEISALSVLGKNKANIYAADGVYQLKGAKNFNALKYVNFYYRYRNIMKGEENAEFLGV